MPLLDPIVEVMKPSMLTARIVNGAVPENIQPILTLMRCCVIAFEQGGIPFWEITTEDGKDYVRVQQHYILDDEAEWTRLIGMLLDYAKSKGGE